MSVARCDATDDFAVQITERRKQSDRTVAYIVVSAGAYLTDPERQSRLGPLQGLALRFFVAAQHHGAIRRQLSRFRGRELDTAGDGFFATFDGPARAIRCAQAIVEGVRPLDLAVRAGLHTGEVELADGKVAGIAVNIGAMAGTFPFDIHTLMDRNQTLIGSAWFTAAEGDDIAALARAGILDLSVFEHLRYPLRKVNDAISGIAARNGGFSNFVIMP